MGPTPIHMSQVGLGWAAMMGWTELDFFKLS